MTGPLSRRRLLAAAAPGLLAGCLVESEADADAVDPDDRAEEDGSEPNESSTDAAESPTDPEGSSTEQVDDAENTPEAIGPNGSGLAVTNTEVRSVADDGSETTVRARLTVENAGGFTYGTVEFRTDAYATRPGSTERDAVGYGYATRRFPSNDRFDGGTRRFDVTVSFRSSESRARANPDWYEVDVAVRRAKPV